MCIVSAVFGGFCARQFQSEIENKNQTQVEKCRVKETFTQIPLDRMLLELLNAIAEYNPFFIFVLVGGWDGLLDGQRQTTSCLE
jgi:hypothetical protein